ncbi:RNA polymerase sigma factor [Luteolibacter marinus]|uniref:RNA polymerase sigma factor n=1 Tax=Luteolibacter marinus TaxID=2776705 RepID=UPI0018667B05|nr:RNA polymerase sigma factor [Luteolibacter marinus]
MPDSGPSDAELLADWLDRQLEPAFHALVARYAGLVNMAARRTCGDETLAAEASQLTFITLARKARSLASRASIAGWLHLTAVRQAKNLLRLHQRETRKRQLLRTHMDTEPQGPPADAWKHLQPVLDEALAALSSKDRETLLLRFYRSLSVREVAAALGIATDAAQKRLNRATERLRRQLARRGCEAGGSLGAIMLAGFHADAQAAAPSAASLATKALAASTAGGTTSLTTLAIIMTKKTAITAGAAVLLLAGGGMVALNQSRQTENATTASAPEKATGTGSSPSAGLAPVESADAKTTRSRPRDPAENPEFVATYGEARTNLSKHVAGNVISLIEDAVEMGEMATSGELGNAFGGPREAMKRGLGGIVNDLNLTDDQQEQAIDLYADFQKREIERAKDTIGKLKKDPTALMQLMLASDAYTRGEITEDEYKQLQVSSGEDLPGLLNPLDRQNMRGRPPLEEETFRNEFGKILDDGQSEQLDATLAEKEAQQAEQGDTRGISNLPAMELEKLDTTIESARKFTTGIKSMMEGVGGLQDLGPLMEQQRKAREAQRAAE